MQHATTTAPGAARQFLFLGLWFALAAGISEATVQIWRIFAQGRIVWRVGPSVVWMAPLGNALFFAALALLLTQVARLVPRWCSLRQAAAAYAFASVVGIAALWPALHTIAVLALAAGAAGVLLRWNARPSAPVGRWLWFTGAAMAAAVVLAALFLAPRLAPTDREPANATAKPPAQAPNLLLVVLDTVRARSLSTYGYPRLTTPNLTRFAARGVRFAWAMSASPWTLPSHAAMFTGRLPHELFDDWKDVFDDRAPTIAERLTEAGYDTAGFVANLAFCTYQCGLNRGFCHYEDLPRSLGQVAQSTSLLRQTVASDWFRQTMGWHRKLNDKPAREIVDSFLSWLDGRDKDRPYFAFLNLFDVHDPYESPPSFAGSFGHPAPRTHFIKDEAPRPEVIAELQCAYDAALAYTDHELGRLFYVLEQRGALHNTAVVVVGDHGEQFGEHGLVNHGNSLYTPLLHVPLFVVWPDHAPPGAVVDPVVSTADMAATLADFAGVPGGFPGSSLARHWSQSVSEPARPVLAQVDQHQWHASALLYRSPLVAGALRAAFNDQLHYLLNLGTGREELYSYRDDPGEERDVIGESRFAEDLAQFRADIKAVER